MLKEKTARHLWEYDHPYYCASTNYFSNDCTQTFGSWASFIEAEGDADLDMNLVFRWDWQPPSEDRNGHVLKLFYMGQRKGLFRSVSIDVERKDEPEVRKWLLVRAAHLRRLWEPLIPPVEESPPPEAPKPYVRDESRDKVGTCESCDSPDVKITSYPTGSSLLGTERTRWSCRICAETHIGNWTEYRHYDDNLRETGRAIAYATNRVIGLLNSDERGAAMEKFIDEMRRLSGADRKRER